jgi:hypothetical protein
VRPHPVVGPHAEETTKGGSGIRWAETWPGIRYCRSVAIRTLLEVSRGGNCATDGIELFRLRGALSLCRAAIEQFRQLGKIDCHLPRLVHGQKTVCPAVFGSARP